MQTQNNDVVVKGVTIQAPDTYNPDKPVSNVSHSITGIVSTLPVFLIIVGIVAGIIIYIAFNRHKN